jgi:teichuronic acid exporter
VNNGINQLPVFLLGYLSSTSAVGYYNMNQRILGLPIYFVSNSLGEVFRQRASEDFHQKGSCRPIFIKTLKVLLLLSIVPFAIITLWGQDIFAWALGEKWRNAGVYTQALALMFFFRFIANPLSYVYVIAGNLKGDFLNHIYFFVSSLLILYFLIPVSVTTALFAFSLNYSLIYIMVLFRSYQLAVNNDFRLGTV